MNVQPHFLHPLPLTSTHQTCALLPPGSLLFENGSISYLARNPGIISNPFLPLAAIANNPPIQLIAPHSY